MGRPTRQSFLFYLDLGYEQCSAIAEIYGSRANDVGRHSRRMCFAEVRNGGRNWGRGTENERGKFVSLSSILGDFFEA